MALVTAVLVLFALSIFAHRAVALLHPTKRQVSSVYKGEMRSISGIKLHNRIEQRRIVQVSSTELDNDVIELRDKLLEQCDSYKSIQKELWNTEDPSDYETVLCNKKEEIIKTIDQLSNFTLEASSATAAWLTPEEPNGEHANPLHGKWTLRFTDAPDATFKPGRRGPVTTSQQVNASVGIFTNIIDFNENPGKLRRIAVTVQGDAVDKQRFNLVFKRATIIRNSRWKLNRIIIPFQNLNPVSAVRNLLRRRRGLPIDTGDTYFTVLYLDEDLRIHCTGQGYLFVQSRLYDFWDPMKGWTEITMI